MTGPDPADPPGAPVRRQARLALARLGWRSVLLMSLLLSVFAGVALLVATAVLYAVLAQLGVVGSVNAIAAELGLTSGGRPLLSAGAVLGWAATAAAVAAVAITALAALLAALLNLATRFTGGVQVTLSERR